MSDLAQKLAISIETYRLLQNVRWNDDRTFSGQLSVSPVATDLKDRLDKLGILLGSPFHHGILELTVLSPIGLSIFFAKDWTDYLERKPFRIGEVEDFYIAEDDYWHQDRSTKDTPRAQGYRDILEIVAILLKVADHVESDSGSKKLIFLHQGKLELVVRYGATDLVSQPSLPALRELLETAPHEEQKRTILKTVLSDMLKNIPPETRFSHLLSSFEEICMRVNDNYQVFVSGFSFDAAREQLEERKMEYMVKLNGVLTEIQNKFLAIPLALLLASGQMEDKGAFTWKNLSILIGAILFGLLMLFLVNNQRHTLRSIWEEIAQRRDRYKDQNPTLFSREKIKEVFDGLHDRYRRQMRTLRLLDIVIICGLLLTCWVYFQLTPDAWPTIKSVFISILNFFEQLFLFCIR
ncbi:MAG: hypothetical protein HQL97_04435 [Magnetococcales bacterium]|nr:hypothetical protein [Magnetococcales bacterium]